jgi:hypothetical protein
MTATVNVDDLRGVFSVPPLARRADPRRSLDFEQNDLIVRHIVSGGVTRFIYGGNAFLYHITLQEYDELIGWMADRSRQLDDSEPRAIVRPGDGSGRPAPPPQLSLRDDAAVP